MRVPFRRRHPHPDEAEAREWVHQHIEPPRSLSYGELLNQRDDPVHYAVLSRTGRKLMGETFVSWDSGQGGPLRVMVDVCEPSRGVVFSIASDDFMRSPDGSFVGE